MIAMSYVISATDALDLSLNESDTVKSVIMNIGILLRTRQGTIPMFREFGLPMRFLDRPLPVARVLMFNEIKEAIEQFEPRAELVDITYTVDEKDPGRLIPSVEVNIRDEQS